MDGISLGLEDHNENVVAHKSPLRGVLFTRFPCRRLKRLRTCTAERCIQARFRSFRLTDHTLAASVDKLERSMSRESDVPEAARAPESMAWGTPPALYLSYGMVSLRGRRPALTDAVAAAQSFTALSPPLGLDYFAVLDGGLLGTAAAIAERIDGELRSEAPRFRGGASHDVAGWWRMVIGEAFQTVNGEVVASGGAGATALVALVLEKYIVVVKCGGGASKAVLSRGGEHVGLTPDRWVKLFLLSSFMWSSSYEPPPVTAEPDVVAVERKQAQDDFLILASDGLWGAVTAALACGLVRRRLAPVDAARGSPAAVLAKELADKALYAGSEDNVSVAIVLFKDFWAQSANK
ncbi:hypothetical protein SETIT_5G019800v2 [Setaria italica]|uniref:protein-serine/threonine phosphatase n=1 Tax=Setaria italica TaxID=4555 RepID=A0A368R234_SETIT|nr:hypothetical protein SETIT_5G019800v2 [Setaria italica]